MKPRLYKLIRTGRIATYDDWIEAFNFACFQMEIEISGIEYFKMKKELGYFIEVDEYGRKI